MEKYAKITKQFFAITAICFMLTMLVFVSSVKAAGPANSSTCTSSTANANTGCTLGTVNALDIIVVSLQAHSFAACPTFASAWVTDGAGLTFILASPASNCNSVGTKITVAWWYAVNNGATVSNDGVTIHASAAPGNMGNGNYYIEAYSVSGLSGSGVTAAGDSNTGNTCAACTTLADTTTSFTAGAGATFWAGVDFVNPAVDAFWTIPSGYQSLVPGTGNGGELCNGNYAPISQPRAAACAGQLIGGLGGATTLPSTAQASSSTTIQGAISAGISFALSTASANTQTQTIGSCPAKNDNTFTPTNATIYLYQGNALGQEVVNTIQVNIASVTGSVSQNIQLVIYVGTQQGISINNPSTLGFSYTKSLSSGTKNQQFTVQTNLPLNTAAASPLPFNYWAVGVIATNHVLLNQSSLAGLVTVAGSAAGSTQPLSYTATTANTNMIALCATGSYQSILPAITTTTTAAATTTVITTSTSTVLTVGTGLLTSASNLPVIFLILLLPAGLFLGITKNLAGGLVGLLIGAVVGELMGILPIWAFTGLVVSLIALAFVVARRGE